MIEIILMVVLAKKLGKIAQSKGRSGGWAALGPAFWIGGEVLGMVLMVMIGLDGAEMYLGALVGAVVGALTAYVIVNGLQANELWSTDGVADGISGGAYDPSNPYNAPSANPYQGQAQPQPVATAPTGANPNSPFG